MKILMPILHYKPVIGGFEIFIQNVAERIAASEEIFVVTGRVKGVPNKEKQGNLTIVRASPFILKNLSHSPFRYIFWSMIFIFFKSRKLIKKEKIDLMHCQGFLSGILGYLLKKITKVPYIITIQSADFSVYHPRVNIKLVKTLYKFFEKKVFQNASKCHAVSNYLGEHFRKYEIEDPVVIPNGVNREKFKPDIKKRITRRGLGFDTDNLIICISRLEPKNGTEDLIKAADILKRKIYDFKIIVIGDGSQRSRLEKLVNDFNLKETVVFLGDILHSGVPKYLASADVFIRPSLAEGFGIVFIEAMACGVPVIGTSVGGIPDFIREGETGLFCEPGNPESIAKKIDLLLTNQTLRNNIIKNAIKLVEEEYNWDKISGEVQRIYKKLIKMHKDVKKICIITGTFRPGASGPSTYIYNLCNILIKKGFKISIITYGDLTKEGDFSQSKWRKAVGDYSCPIKRISRRYPLPLRLIVFFYNILSIGRHHDILYVNDYGLPAAFANFFLRKPMVIKIVGDFAWEYSIRRGLVHPSQDIDEFQKRKFGFRVWFFKKLQKFYVKRAKKIIAPSNYFKSIISGWGVPEEKIKVIYNAVDTGRYILRQSKKNLRKRLELEPETKIILTVARLSPWKGIDKMICIFPEIAEKVPAKYLVIGEGDNSNLKKIAGCYDVEDKVIFLGKINYLEMPFWFKLADVLVLYSGYEGFSHVILEAMAAGLPVIASEKGGNPEAIGDGLSGVLVPWGEVEELQKAIIKVLTNQEFADKLSREAKKRVKEFNWDKLVEETLEVFRAVGSGC